MKRKKILWLCSWYPSASDPFNGDFIQRHAKAASLFNDIYVIYVGGSHKEEKSLNLEQGLTEQIILYKNKTGIGGRFLNHLKWQKLFKQAVQDYISKNGKPDLVHVQVPIKAGLIALWIKKKFGIPYIITEHWGGYNNVLKGNYRSKPAWFKRLTKNIFSNASAGTSVSGYLADNIRNYVSTELTFRIINNVVDTNLFNAKEKQSGKFRFIHVSNMIPLKNAEGIIAAFFELNKTIPDTELIMVGDKEPGLRQIAEKLGLLGRSVFFRGEISYAEVATEMKQADCLILFSNIENSPCVIVEALCCGVPVIATQVGGIPELVNNENGILVEPGNTTQLTEAMKRIMNNNISFDKRKIAKSAQNKFSYSIIGKQFDELYNSVQV